MLSFNAEFFKSVWKCPDLELVLVFPKNHGEEVEEEANTAKETSIDAAAVSAQLDDIFTLKITTKNDTEGFYWWITCLRFTPKWFWRRV